MDLIQGISFLKDWGPVLGPSILILAFFLWKDWRREVRLQDRVEVLEKEQKELILPLLKQNVEVIAQNNLIMQRLEKVLGKCTAALKDDQRDLLERLTNDDTL
jgi:hypothetical protein